MARAPRSSPSQRKPEWAAAPHRSPAPVFRDVGPPIEGWSATVGLGRIASDPLVEVRSPEEARRLDVQDYDLMIVDWRDAYDPDMQASVLQLASRAHRVGITGEKCPVPLSDVGVVTMGHLSAITDGAPEASEPGSQLAYLCTHWTARKWPATRLVLVDDGQQRFPELEAACDQALRQPLRFEGSRLVDVDGVALVGDLRDVAMLDHTAYRLAAGEREHSVHAALGQTTFHAPIRHPMSFTFKPADLRWRLRELTSLRIAVIDERVFRDSNVMAAETYTKAPGMELEGHVAWRRLGVDIIDPEAIPVRGLAIRRNQIRNATRRIASGRYDFVVVHRGWLDKWFHDNAVDVASRDASVRTGEIDSGHGIDRLIDQFLGWGDTLVLVSGRGPERRRFGRKASRRIRQIEFSVLKEAMLTGKAPDKMRLATLLTCL